MARVLIQLKLTLLRHTLRNGQASFLQLGATVGLVVAAWMLLLGFEAAGGRLSALDTLALAMALWALGWLLVSTTGGGDPLRPEFFGLLPVRVGRLARNLLAASFVGVLPIVTLVAFAALVVAAAAFGILAILVAAVCTVLVVALISLVALVVVGASGQAVQSRVGFEIAAFARAVLVSLIWIWVPISVIAGAKGLPPDIASMPPVADLTRLLPTGWGVAAVEAVGRSDWLLAGAAVVGLIVLVAFLFRAWTALLERRLTGAGGRSRTATAVRERRITRLLERSLPATPFGAALGRELRSWARDPRRAVEVRSAIWTGLILSGLPFFFGSSVLLPFAGLLIVLAAASTTANVYGMDGTAIWLAILIPGSERVDVVARQVAWLLVFGPIGLVATLALGVLSGAGWTLPWVLTALVALTAAAAGLVPLISLLLPAPLPEHRGGDPLDLGDDPRTTGGFIAQGVVMTFVPPVLAAPAVLLAFAAGSVETGLEWGGLIAAVVTGVVWIWLFGRLAARRLATQGPELLDRMRARPAPVVDRTKPRQAAVARSTWALFILGSILLFPQALVPFLIRLSGSETRVWFVPLYLPDPLQLPAMLAFAAVGLAAYAVAWRQWKSRPAGGRGPFTGGRRSP